MIIFRSPLLILVFITYVFSKCLIISVDNRDLSTNINDNQYASMNAVINLDYANHQGYDFVYVQNEVSNLVPEANQKYPNSFVIPPTNIAKDIATAFHVGLKQFRAASWAKLPPIWHILTTVGAEYEYIWYIDSDACISPLHRNRTIEESVRQWERDAAVERGNRAVSRSAFIFFNNRPWRDDMPCAGSFIFRPQHPSSDIILRQWWDFDLPSKNFKHFHEQDALWHMIEAESVDTQWRTANPGRAFALNSSTFTVTTERQFPSVWTRYEDLWLCHVASYNFAVRLPVLYQFLRLIGRDSEASFRRSVEAIAAQHTLRVRSLDVTERMEARSVQDGVARLVSFPAHSESTQSAWYDQHVTSRDQPALPAPTLHEGRLIRRKGEFFLVCGGKRHGFESFDVFLRLGLHKDLGHAVGTAEVAAIEEGALITAARIAAVKDTHPISGFCPDNKFLPLSVEPGTLKGPSPVLVRAIQSGTEGGGRGKVQDCDTDSTLESLVAANGTRSVLYLVSHDNASEALARRFAACKERWVRPVRIASSVFFESAIFRDVLPAQSNQWEGLDFVITATYKTVAKQLHYNGFNQNLPMIRTLLETARDGQYDIVPFLRSGSGTMSFCLYWHGEPFRTAWDALLGELGYNTSTIRALDESKPFYRNIYIIRPAVLRGLITFMDRAMAVATNNPKVRGALSVDSRYKEGQEEVALRIFGTKYYQLHPFVFERLPSFYLHSIGARICHYPTDGPCKYNT